MVPTRLRRALFVSALSLLLPLAAALAGPDPATPANPSGSPSLSALERIASDPEICIWPQEAVVFAASGVATPTDPGTGSAFHAVDDDTPAALPPLASGQILLEATVIATFPYGVATCDLHLPETASTTDSEHLDHHPAFAVVGDAIHLLDVPGRQILSCDSATGSRTVLLRDRKRGLLHFTDFAMMKDQTVALADNTRNAVYLFKQRRFLRTLGQIGERKLFSHIRYIFADPAGSRLAVYDSARNRTYVCNVEGKLLFEMPLSAEPIFFGNSLIHLEKTDKSVRVDVHDTVLRSSRALGRYTPKEGNIILDAWVAGCVDNRLFMVVYEGIGDEDHLDYAKLVTLHDGVITVRLLPPSTDLETDVARRFLVARIAGRYQLLEPFFTGEGVAIRGFGLD